MEAYQDSTSEAYSYLVVDCDPKSLRDLKLRTKIFQVNKLSATV